MTGTITLDDFDIVRDSNGNLVIRDDTDTTVATYDNTADEWQFADAVSLPELIDGANVSHTGELADVTDLPEPVDISDNGTLVVSDASDINFSSNLTVTDDGDGTVTVDASGGGGSEGVPRRLDPTRESSNPVVTPDTFGYTGNDGEAYEGAPIIAPDGTYYMYCKYDPGTNSDRIAVAQSSDGVSWTDTGYRFTASDSAGSPNEVMEPGAWYDPSDGTYHLYYRAEGDNTVRHASGSSPTNLSDTTANPVVSGSDIANVVPDTTVNYPSLVDIVVHNGTFYAFGGYYDGNNNLSIFRMSGSGPTSLSTDGILIDHSDVSSTVVQAPTVALNDGMWHMLFSEGDRQIYYAAGSLNNFYTDMSPAVLAEVSSSWESKWVYYPHFLKKQDGNYDTLATINGTYPLYYSGQDNGTTSFGSVGIAYMDSLPTSGVATALTR